MDPQLKSILTTFIATAAGSIATYAVSKGIIPGEDQAGVADAIVSGVLYLITAGIVWWKARQHTPTAQIAAVNNADNGCKVVAATAPAPAVTAPQKGN